MDFLAPSIPFIQKIQSVSWLLTPMRAASLLGNEEFFLLLLPLIYWLVNRKLGAQLGILLLISVCLNDIAKLMFHLPRPYWSGLVFPLSVEKSFGFPSGHAQNASLLWPFVALQSKNKKKWFFLSIALLALISFSRVYLGVHYPLDILGGWLIGFTLLFIAVRYQSFFISSWIRFSLFERLGIIFLLVGLISLAFAFTGLGETYQGGTEMTLSYENAAQSMIARIAALTGLFIALVLAPQYDTGGSTFTKCIRLVVGLAGLAFVYIGLKKILPDENLYRFIRYFLTTFWVIFAAPMLFLKLGLVQSAKTNRSVD
jgi:membrane-associated phospholipid phosphatase